MTKESLIELGLTEEQADKVMESLNGAFVPKARFNEVNSELKTAKATIKERDTQLETLKAAGGDMEALKQQITDLQTANSAQQEAHESEIKAMKISNAVGMALTNAKAKNNIAVQALLADFISKAELTEKGTVKGLDDEIKRLVDGKDTAFLFDKATGKQFKGAKAAEKGDGGDDVGSMTLERFRAMPAMERHDFSINHPEEYKAMYGGNE